MLRLLIPTLLACAVAVSFSGPAPAQPQAGDPKQISADLAEVEKAIAAKERELATLKEKAQKLRDQLAAGKKPGKVYTSLADLLADIPKDALPLPGADGTIERSMANKWLAKEVVGRIVEIKATIASVAVEESRVFKGKWAVTVRYDFEAANAWEEVQVNNTAWKWDRLFNPDGSFSQGSDGSPRLIFLTSDDEAAKKVRDMKNKSVVIRFQVRQAAFASDKKGPTTNAFRMQPESRTATIDGFNPNGLKPGDPVPAK